MRFREPSEQGQEGYVTTLRILGNHRAAQANGRGGAAQFRYAPGGSLQRNLRQLDSLVLRWRWSGSRRPLPVGLGKGALGSTVQQNAESPARVARCKRHHVAESQFEGGGL